MARRAAEHREVVRRGVALRARDVVPAGHRESRVAERALLPRGVGRLVARLAGRREAGRRVIGIARAVVVGQVAADAVARRAPVDVVDVAGRARLRRVDADQREDRRCG